MSPWSTSVLGTFFATGGVGMPRLYGGTTGCQGGRMWYIRSMAPATPFLNTPYGAYLAREVPPPDDELTRVGPGTPCGEYLRRFWQPVAFARDLGDVPLRIKIMSEDL